ncbi:ATP synthase subunit e, mitochondrial-like [Oppia nitens]|uniref:ATP synthase subunit e, mitochondrial-like n=1 Tax=Oppia nitens TaxID=1686743 RepID=UPI0023DA17D6|nr:ATP synthase subunit e, mitochondrial-like [Oppia nitens]
MTTKWDLPKLELKAPVNVSPFLRFCRWSLLLAGVAYGLRHNQTLAKREREHRIQLREKKKIWDEEQRIIKLKANRDEMLYLAEETKTPIPANFDQMYPK